MVSRHQRECNSLMIEKRQDFRGFISSLCYLYHWIAEDSVHVSDMSQHAHVMGLVLKQGHLVMNFKLYSLHIS